MKKKSEKEIKEELKQRLEEIKILEKEAQQQGLVFSSPTETELEKKISGVSGNSPYIYAQSWTSGTAMGNNASYRVYVANPDPVSYYPVFVSVFFGVANFASSDNLQEALSRGNFNGNNNNFPCLSSTPFSLASGATNNILFTYTTPNGVPSTNYIGNSVLWGGSYHDQGSYFDRGLFYVNLF